MAKRGFTREQSMTAKPVATEVIRREPLPNGCERVTIHIFPEGIHRWLLRMPARMERSYDLDAMGLEVLAMCDGQKTVRHIITRVAKKHRINEHESERAVITFLRTMAQKGLLSLVVTK